MSNNGYIEVVRRYRLWAAVPPDERVTEQTVRDNTNASSPYLAEELERLANPQCIVALKHARYKGLWSPCNLPVKPGEDRCKTHGGASARTTPEPGPTRKELQAEVDRLRARLEVTA